MSYDENIKQKALHLRNQGHSFYEISTILTIPQGTIYTWTKNLVLNDKAQKRIIARKELGRQNAIKSRQEKIASQQQSRQKQIEQDLEINLRNPSAYKIITACLYWAEGSKNQNSLIFTNSDPTMINLFLTALRRSYSINESKFRVLIHLHQYHDPQEILDFWSQTTRIPLRQFYKPYLKPNTGSRKHEKYNGCCSIRYYDANLARLITTTYRHIAKILI